MRDVVIKALKSVTQGDGTGYKKLLDEFFAEETEAGLHKWLRAMTQCVSSFQPQVHDTLIKTILKIDLALTEPVFETYHQFILNMVSSNGTYAVACFDALVKNLLPIDDERGEEVHAMITARTHKILARLLNICPTSSSSLLLALSETFPHRRMGANYQTTYLRNILVVTDYWPILREKVLAIIIDKLIQIDVEIKLEEVHDDDDLLFEVDEEPALKRDDDDDDTNSVGAAGEAAAAAMVAAGGTTAMVHPGGADGDNEKVNVTADKLDQMMMIMFQYLSNKCSSSQQTSDDIFILLRGFFYKSVLHTHRSKYTQFLLFFVTSLYGKYAEMFLGHMHQKLFAVSEANVTRMTCAAYVGSFLARATWLECSTITLSLNLLMRWLNMYLDRIETSQVAVTAPNPEAHCVFYSVCQSVLYVVCYKHELLWKTEAGRACLRDGNLTRIVHSALNPLKVCLDSVVREFARVGFALQLCDCYEVMRHNKAVLLAGRSMYGAEPQLEMFFPFDPYLLKESSQYIKHIYQVWKKPDLAITPELDSDASDGGYASEGDSDEEDEDDEEEGAAEPASPEVDAMGESFSKSFSFGSHEHAMNLATTPTASAFFLNRAGGAARAPSATIHGQPSGIKRVTSNYF